MVETYATGFVNPKTTALFFDKLYVPKEVILSSYGTKNGFNLIPNEVLFTYDKEQDEWFSFAFEEYCCLNSGMTYSRAFRLPSKEFESDEYIYLDEKYHNYRLKKRLKKIYNSCGEFHTSIYRNTFLQLVAQKIKKKLDINLVPIFFDKTDFEKELEREKFLRDWKFEQLNIENSQKVDKTVYEAIISSDQMIDESKLNWEQVLEIRRDKAEQAKLKRFRSWINSDFDNCSKEQIIEKINNTYSDYAEALKKHGVKTLTGSLATIVSEAAIGVLSTWGGNTVNYIGLGLQLAIGAIPLGKTVMDYVKLRKEPIAYYYDIKKKI